MIRSLRVTAGYAAKLSALQERTFEFQEGLTALFGANASGKSTMLRVMGAYSGCEGPGWTTYSEEYERERRFSFPREKTPPFPERFAEGILGDLRAEVAWDGTPTYYSVGLPAKGQRAFEEALGRGGDDADDYMRSIMAPGSSGQAQVHWLNERLERTLSKPPTLARDATFFLKGRSEWSTPEGRKHRTETLEGIDDFIQYVESLPRTGPVTVLLDEPDTRLSLPNQETFWRTFAPRLAIGRQIIIATHSPFGLLAPTVLDLTAGYADRCRQALRGLFG